MKGLLKIILIVSWVFLLPIEILALEHPKPPIPPAQEAKPIEITADAMQKDTANNIIKAKGHVVVSYEGKTIRADKLIINTVSGKGVAVGHVLITDEGMRVKARRSKFNLKTHQGRLYHMKGVLARKTTAGLPGKSPTPGGMTPPGIPTPGTPADAGMPNAAMTGTPPTTGLFAQTVPGVKPQKVEYYVKGEELTKLGENHYKTVNTSLTTCKGNLPDWMIEAKSADLKVGDRALFKGGILKVRDVPVLYLPAGYISLDNERKSGFLTPAIGNSTINGFTTSNAYYWAINEQSDATIFADYMGARGIRPGVEYRYTPSKTTNGVFFANYLQDQSSEQTFYKVNWGHSQRFESNLAINGKLDLIGNNNPDRTFNDSTLDRTRRNTDSFLTANKNWGINSLDITTRYRQSTDNTINDTFGVLPQATFRTLRTTIGNMPLYFNQDSSASVFYTNLTPTAPVADHASVQRYDFHPQIGMPVRPASWLTITPTIGIRETYYSQGIDANNNRYEGFSRQLLDFTTNIEAPKFTKTFTLGEESHKIKHLIEPRMTYSYIANNNDTEDRQKIKVFDNIDSIIGMNRLTYYLTQRFLQKKVISENLSENREVLKFEVSQYYDFKTVDQVTASSYYNNFVPGLPTQMREFSPVRFDLRSRLIDALMVNANATYDIYDYQLRTFNFEFGIKPTNSLSLLLERRFSRDLTTFLVGSAILNLPKGWKLQNSMRYDEILSKVQENDFSLGFNDPCRCWGVSFDFIRRFNYNLGLAQEENKYMINLNLLGLGTLGTGQGQNLMHRNF